MAKTRSQTLADAALPGAGALESTLLILGASLLTGLAAQIAIPLPFTPVPVTGQTFAVLLTGAALGWRRGFLAQLAYLGEGAMGLPVFAGGASGPLVFAGPTGGYLIAFPLAAAVTGWLAERAWDRRVPTMLGVMLLGSLVIFAIGLAGLSRFMPVPDAFVLGVLPFLPGDCVKSTLAALVFPTVWRQFGRSRDRV